MKRNRSAGKEGTSAYEMMESPYGPGDAAGSKDKLKFLDGLTIQGKDLRSQFRIVKTVVKENPLVAMLLRAKLAFWNYRFRVVPVAEDGKTISKAARKQFARWHEECGAEIRKWQREFLGDALTYSNAVTFWYGEASEFKPQPGWRVLVLDLERCKYNDKLGQPKLSYEHLLTAQDVTNLKLTGNNQERYSKPVVDFDPQYGEFFKVYSRAKRGSGFAEPDLRTVVTAVQEWMGHEAGDGALAMASRKVIRQAKLGHEVKHGLRAGTLAGTPTKETIAAIKKAHESRHGYMEEVTRFDQEWVLVTVDPKLFTTDKWEQVSRRIGMSFSSLYRMLFDPGASPYLLPTLKAQAEEERAEVADVMVEVINEAWAPPIKVGVQWSSRIFTDARLAADLLKFAVQQGSASLRSLNKEAGLDHEEQARDKEEEAASPKLWVPLWDPSHGNRPGSNPTDEPHGRPAGGGK